jgi:hypothetical protein
MRATYQRGGMGPVEVRARLEAVVAAPGPQHRLLHRVLGLEGRAEHPVAVAGQLPAVLLESLLELTRPPLRDARGHPGTARDGWAGRHEKS